MPFLEKILLPPLIPLHPHFTSIIARKEIIFCCGAPPDGREAKWSGQHRPRHGPVEMDPADRVRQITLYSLSHIFLYSSSG
ncbi:hypothetical protein JTE90_007165 [Oedothorax gibbosus]|uniref:Uncharacterized protein n=1 Tax=Oedothorax gibbosus TaxID=931172 RepID=A0AAV6UVS1_9ARAC|nr:hypothetical protein JTE90_007165 [Oedothorax gibbosus]